MTLSAEQLALHDRMVSAMEESATEILASEAVRGTAVGLREENGTLTDELAIIVYVRSAEDALEADVPTTIGGFPVVVEEGDFRPQSSAPTEYAARVQADTKRYNPLLGGISIAPSRSHDRVGTLGLMVCGNNAGEDVMMLSNYHVMCLNDGKAEAGQDICQEARVDNSVGWCGNCAVLTRWHAGNVDIAGKAYGVDAAVALRTARGARLSEVVSIGKLEGVEKPAVGMAVQKRGRTTGLTSGTIQSITASIKKNVGPSRGEIVMSNQVSVVGDAGPFTAGGDSGSVYISTTSSKVVGLHWGAAARTSVGNHIDAVLAALNITIPSAPEGGRRSRAEDAGPV